MTNSPCYKCDKRTAICRIGCGDFKQWQDLHHAEKEKIIEAEKMYYLGTHDFDMLEKSGRKQRWK